MHDPAVLFARCNFLLTFLEWRREKQCLIVVTWACPSQMRRESFVCPPNIMASCNQWSVILIHCLQFQRLVRILSFRSLKNTVVLANMKCHTLRPDKLRPKCFKSSKVIITKCLISKHTPFICFHRMKCPSQSRTAGTRPEFLSWPFGHFGSQGNELSLWASQYLPFRVAEAHPMYKQGRGSSSAASKSGVASSKWVSRSPPEQSKLCVELLLPVPSCSPCWRCSLGTAWGNLAQRSRTTLSASSLTGWLISKEHQSLALS